METVVGRGGKRSCAQITTLSLPASALRRAEALTVSLAGSERHRPDGCGGGVASRGDRISQTWCQMGSAWKQLLNSLSCFLWSWKLLTVPLNSPTGKKVLESIHCWEPKETERGTAGSSRLPRREQGYVEEEVSAAPLLPVPLLPSMRAAPFSLCLSELQPRSDH